jgi:outer membrane protein assembly factor BamB
MREPLTALTSTILFATVLGSTASCGSSDSSAGACGQSPNGLCVTEINPDLPGPETTYDVVAPVVVDATIADVAVDASSDAPSESTPGYGPLPDPSSAPSYLINPAHSGTVADPTFMPPLARLWTATFSAAVSYPLIAQGLVYIVTNVQVAAQAQLVALERMTGSTVFSVDLGQIPFVTTAYDLGRLFVVDTWFPEGGGPGVRVRAYDAATGALLWTTIPDGAGIFGLALVAYRGILYVDGGTSLYAYNESTGALLWRQDVGAGEGTPAVSDQGVFISEGCERILAFDRVNGSPLWQDLGQCGGGGGDKTPVLFGQRLYNLDVRGNLEFDVATGAVVGAFTADLPPAFDVATGFYVASGALHAANATQGTTSWTFMGDGQLATSPIVIGGCVYVGSKTGKLFAVRGLDGLLLWSDDTGAPLVSSEQTGTATWVALAAGEGLLVVPSGTNLIAYMPSGSSDAGTRDGASVGDAE